MPSRKTRRGQGFVRDPEMRARIQEVRRKWLTRNQYRDQFPELSNEELMQKVQGREQRQSEYTDIAARNLAGLTVGLPGDLQSIFHEDLGRLQEQGKALPTSEQMATQLGGDPTHPSFLPGAFLAPGPGELKGLLAAGPLAFKPKSIGVGIRTGHHPPPQFGSGHRGQVVKEDAARHLERLHRGLLGRRVADPSTGRGMSNMVSRGIEDIEHQLQQKVTGRGWYDEDIDKTFDLLTENFDIRYMDPNYQTLWTGVAASTSFGTPVNSNAKVATKAMQHFFKTGRVPSKNPDTGKLWTMRDSGRQGLEMTQFLLDKFGLDGYREFMLSPTSVRNIAQLRKESGIFKAGRPLPAYKGDIGKLDDTVRGAYILGPKGGPFMLNLNGFPDTTVDLWHMRGYGRNKGLLLHPQSGQLIDAPISPAERKAVKEYTQRIADRFGFSEQDTQAIKWYFEQQLYDSMGVSGAVPKSFSEGVESLILEQASRPQ